MSSARLTAGIPAGAVFDRLASSYDRDFTDSAIGRAQRNAVWQVLLATFPTQANVLELNCGTGEDALFLADHGISVFACDASAHMVAHAEQRLQHMAPLAPVVFCHLATERIGELDPVFRFDGVFSNFSGLNCVADLRPVAANLSMLVKPGDKLLLCVSTRFCLIEITYYLAQGNMRKAFRRCKGETEATIDGASLKVFYPTVSEIRRSFAPHFRLTSVTGIGVAIPPSYLETWAQRHLLLLRLLIRLEHVLARLPILRTTSDHTLLRFEKVSPR
jgi:SAM-dependent methyltransferase